MEIKKTKNGTALTLAIVGRIDTTTAPQLELELKGGSAEAMLAFARKLAGKYGLREEQRSKFARARALASAR